MKNTVKTCWLVFCILIIVHGFEAIVLRMDETAFGENFMNKLIGILMIWIVLRSMKWSWSDIGFAESGLAKSLGLGLALAGFSFLISYAAEIMILKTQGNNIRIGFFTTGFSLTGEPVIHTGAGFILLCVFFNIINVIMEEGTFRGLFYSIVKMDHSRNYALLFQAFLFGIWHIVTPLHHLIDGDIHAAAFFGLSIGYVILAGMMGIKWGLMYRMTGSLYAGMADHFFNNCIATNLLHISTENGIDEMLIVRVLIAQLLSFAIVLAVWMKKEKPLERDEDGTGTFRHQHEKLVS